MLSTDLIKIYDVLTMTLQVGFGVVQKKEKSYSDSCQENKKLSVSQKKMAKKVPNFFFRSAKKPHRLNKIE